MAKPLALTLGEPAGIGPDITIAAWLRRSELKLPPFYLLGDATSSRDRAKALGLDVGLADVRAEDALPHIRRRAAGGRDRPCGDRASPASRTTSSADAAIGLDPAGGRRRARRTGGRGRHQPDRQERAVPRRLPASRPYRISRRTRARTAARRRSR